MKFHHATQRATHLRTACSVAVLALLLSACGGEMADSVESADADTVAQSDSSGPGVMAIPGIDDDPAIALDLAPDLSGLAAVDPDDSVAPAPGRMVSLASRPSIDLLPADAAPPPSESEAGSPTLLTIAPRVPVSAVRNIQVIADFDASRAISEQTWRGVNCYGRTGNYLKLPDQAITGHALQGASALRFGRVQDPTDPTRKAFVFRVAQDDTLFADSRRCEVVAYALPETAIPSNKEFWYVATILPGQGSQSRGDGQLLSQWHALGFNPMMAMYLMDGRLSLGIRYSASSAEPKRTVAKTVWTDSTPVANRWQTYVFQAKISPNPSDKPYLRVWRDGTLIIDYNGALGYYTSQLAYAKIGYYSWNDRNPWDKTQPVRSLHVRRAVLLNGPPALSESAVRTWAATPSTMAPR